MTIDNRPAIQEMRHEATGIVIKISDTETQRTYNLSPSFNQDTIKVFVEEGKGRYNAFALFDIRLQIDWQPFLVARWEEIKQRLDLAQSICDLLASGIFPEDTNDYRAV